MLSVPFDSGPWPVGAVYKPLMPFRFRLSLRLRHPTLRADDISKSLGVTPNFSWSAGEPRRNPEGRTLGGTRDETYWTWSISTSDSTWLGDAIDANLVEIGAHSGFLRDFVSTGGSIEYFVGWFTSKVSGGETLNWELLRRLADYQINISLDVYSAERAPENP